MNISNIFNNPAFGEKVGVKALFETAFTKEIGIYFEAGLSMKEHKTPYPIVVQLIEGKLNFKVGEEIHSLVAGDLLSLEGGVPHSLLAIERSIVRLTLVKADQVMRVEEVVRS